MPAFDAHSRRVLRRRRKAWARRNPVPLAFACASVVAGLILSTAVFTVGPDAAWRWYLLGTVHTALVASMIFAVNGLFLALDREAIHHVRGAWGEENTRELLRRAKRKKLVWGWVDSINLQRGDLDHVVVTRAGGIVVIDSKWRSAVDSREVEAMTRSGRIAHARSLALTRTLLAKETGKRRAKVQPVTVTPVVVVWGPEQDDVPDGTVREGVHFVGGRGLVSWLAALDHDPVDRAAARDLLARLKKYRLNTVDA